MNGTAIGGVGDLDDDRRGQGRGGAAAAAPPRPSAPLPRMSTRATVGGDGGGGGTGSPTTARLRLSQAGTAVLLSQAASLGPMNASGAQGAAESAGNNMFADADALMQGIHANIAKRDYDVSNYYHETGICQAIARSRKFGSLTLFIIAVNALWIGLDTDCNDVKYEGYLEGCLAQPSDELFWEMGEYFFCFCFTFELLVRFGAFQEKRNSLRDNWFKFDALLVSFMVLETVIIPAFPGGGADALNDLALLRIVRLLRLTRMVRLMRSVPELVTLLKGMAIASRSVSYTLLLLVIFMYIFAIIFKSQLADSDSPGLQRAFHNIPRSMWTLMLSGCMLDDITTVANFIIKESLVMAAAFVLFVLLAALMVLNMLIGVLCAVVTAVAAAEKEKALVGYVKHKLMSVLERLDVDGNGTISKAEFDQLIHIPEAVNALEELGVDVANLANLSDQLFEQEEVTRQRDMKSLYRSSDVTQRRDAEDSEELSGFTEHECEMEPNQEEEQDESNAHEVSMTFAEFLEMVIRLRADNTPSVLDIVELRKLIFKGQRLIAKRFHSLEKGQMELQRGIKLIFKQLDKAKSRHSELEVSLMQKRPSDSEPSGRAREDGRGGPGEAHRRQPNGPPPQPL